MNPLFLKIRGINSFEQEQEIDFCKLTRAGIFGIFGSTGSGKSTIPDAMILALYGKMPRYTTNKVNSATFVNTNCKTGYVCFEFEVHKNGKNDVYVIERTFKKTAAKPDDNSLVTTGAVASVSRLYKKSSDSDGLPEIIEDKSSEKVSLAASELIGLGYSDFTRSVVLPQGNFSEFLLLKNADRRSMLERIFNLNEYGEVLNRKILAFNNRVQQKLLSLDAAIAATGEVSDEDLKKECEAVKGYYDEIAKLEELLKENSLNLEKYRQLNIYSAEHEEYSKKQNALALLEPQTAEDSAKLSKSKKAEILIPFIQDLRRLENHRDRAQKEFLGFDRLYTESHKKLLLILEKFLAAHAEKEDKVPVLTARCNEIEQAVLLKIEMENLNAERELLLNKHRKLKSQVSENNQLIAIVNEDIDRKTEQEKKISADIEKLSISNDLLKFLENNADNEKMSANELNRAAVILAKGLSDGVSCPVCGSEDHPNPASGLNEAAHSFHAELEKMHAKGLEREKLGMQEKEIRNLLISLRAKKENLVAIGNGLEIELGIIMTSGKEKAVFLEEKNSKLQAICSSGDPKNEALEINNQIKQINEKLAQTTQHRDKFEKETHEYLNSRTGAEKEFKKLGELTDEKRKSIADSLTQSGFESDSLAESAYLGREYQTKLEKTIADYHQNLKETKERLNKLSSLIGSESAGEIAHKLAAYRGANESLSQKLDEFKKQSAVSDERIRNLVSQLEKLKVLKENRTRLLKTCSYSAHLAALFRGNRFVEFVSQRHLNYISAEASKRLKKMSSGRYALELDGSDFVIRDDFNSGVRRLPCTLSGGEIFMASLCLSLALSSKIQLKNSSSLCFFFLDEGFGSLDETTLETVINSLEQLKCEQMTVGLISHVDSLKRRIAEYVSVTNSENELTGSKITHVYR